MIHILDVYIMTLSHIHIMVFFTWMIHTVYIYCKLIKKKSLNAKFKHWFVYLLVPVANNTLIQVWIESEKVGGQWQFHDGSPIPDVCPILMSNGTEEIHLRAKGSTSFSCFDAPNNNTYHYSCEYHRLLALNNQH